MNEFEYRDSWNGDMMLPDTSYQDYGDVVETFPEHSFTAMQKHTTNYGEQEFEMIARNPNILPSTTWDFSLLQPRWLVEKELEKIKNNS
jgi:hypothetical protein